MLVSERLVSLLEATAIEELSGGHQSRVFRVVRPRGEVVVAKVLDPSLVDRRELVARVDVAVALADLDAPVCRPLPVHAQLVNEWELGSGAPRYVVCFEFADGTELDPGERLDAARMGRALAGVHAAMRRLAPVALPLVAALRQTDVAAIEGPFQLLHGDFNAGNVRDVDGVVQVFDLDDCGYGPPLFDVANALYLVLFDSVIGVRPETYRSFRGSFVGGYGAASDLAVADDVLERFIDLRIGALRAWLDDLTTAPIGIRTASPEWLGILRSFASTPRPRGT